jgi:hypothetical protein
MASVPFDDRLKNRIRRRMRGRPLKNRRLVGAGSLHMRPLEKGGEAAGPMAHP